MSQPGSMSQHPLYNCCLLSKRFFISHIRLGGNIAMNCICVALNEKNGCHQLTQELKFLTLTLPLQIVELKISKTNFKC